jgi:hypothetical protein
MQMARFQKGQSGNPQGKPKGAKDKRTELRSLLRPHAEDLVAKVVELAKSGDTTALRICIDRLIPPAKARDATVSIDNSEAGLSAQGQAVLTALWGSRITPDEAVTLMQAISTQARLIEVDELERRIAALEAQHAKA